MPIRTFKPTSPGRRNSSGATFEEITKSTPEKRLLISKKRLSGRSRQGRISVRHRGGGHKRRIRIIDVRRDKDGVPGRIPADGSGPGRLARTALVFYAQCYQPSLPPPVRRAGGPSARAGSLHPPTPVRQPPNLVQSGCLCSRSNVWHFVQTFGSCTSKPNRTTPVVGSVGVCATARTGPPACAEGSERKSRSESPSVRAPSASWGSRRARPNVQPVPPPP